VFIEFNINHGFFCADHNVDELYQMVAFYAAQFEHRLRPQLLEFDARAAFCSGRESYGAKRTTGGKSGGEQEDWNSLNDLWGLSGADAAKIAAKKAA